MGNMLANELEGRTDGLSKCHLLLDSANVESLGSVEIGSLITLHKKMAASGGRLTLFNLKAEVNEVFTITKLHTLLGICRKVMEIASNVTSCLKSRKLPKKPWPGFAAPNCQRDWEMRITNDRMTVMPAFEGGG
jgi:anti-anti-sigma factor